MRPSGAFSHLLILNLAVTVCGWGDLGHRTVAYLATHYLSDQEIRTVQQLTGFEDISDAAIWPDQISQTPEYSYTSSWHYINVHDDPPSQCGVELPRDHLEGSSDILTAFVNHTAAVVDLRSDDRLVSEALRFITHWVGDVHQPLHAQGLKRGGGAISVFFQGEPTNLHIVWDVHIPEKYRGSRDQKTSAKMWAKELYERDMEPMPSRHQFWCSNQAFDWILSLAKEANYLVCSSVIPDGVQAVENQELGEIYYEQNVPVVERQIAFAGKRLATWLKIILTERLQVRPVSLEPDEKQLQVIGLWPLDRCDKLPD